MGGNRVSLTENVYKFHKNNFAGYSKIIPYPAVAIIPV